MILTTTAFPNVDVRLVMSRSLSGTELAAPVLPVNFSHRCTIVSQYGGSSSIKNALRPVCSQAISVEPLPPNRSRTFSPVSDEYWIARTASSTGFSVKWTI